MALALIIDAGAVLMHHDQDHGGGFCYLAISIPSGGNRGYWQIEREYDAVMIF
jgi:hypothetical protein